MPRRLSRPALTGKIKFGTDGWRGVIADDFTFDNVRIVAQAVADYLRLGGPRSGGRNPGVVVGYDCRFLSDRFALTAAQTLRANGIPVVLSAEVAPTPVVSLLTLKRFSLGIMITASHNPPRYNGFKIKVGGRSSPEAVTAAVEARLGKTRPLSSDAAIPTRSFKPDYFRYLKSRVSVPGILSRLARPVVMDCMHGAGSGLAAELLPSKKVLSIRDRHDPDFGGVHPEPIACNLQALSLAVKRSRAMAGIALDGDADRIGMVDDAGRYLTPCQIYPLLLEYLHESGRLKGKIVQAVSMGYLPMRLARDYGLPFEELPVGFKYIAEKMLREDVAAGAEESGGYSWKGNLPERDALLTALLILEMLSRTRRTPSQLYRQIEKKYGKSCFLRVDFKLARPITDKAAFTEKLARKLPRTILGRKVSELRTIDGLKIILDNDHWLLMRPSGTEPLLRTYAETDSAAKTRAFLDLARGWVARYF